MNILLLTENGLFSKIVVLSRYMGREQDIERGRIAISIGTRQMRYGKEKRKERLYCGPYMDSLFLA